MGLILAGFMTIRGITIDHTIQPFFSPTPTPTRTMRSYQQEADTYFKIGNLEQAIVSYKEVIRQNPDSVDLLAQLARIEVYSSASMSTDQQKLDRLNQALQYADQAVALGPESSTAHAVRAFVLDWLSSNKLLTPVDSEKDLEEGENEATRATQLDPNNAEALAYSAEILADRQQWIRAEQVVQQALDRDPNSMDVHRIYGYVLTTLAQYEQAITEYQKASAINPNLTFLYIDIGQLQRLLWSKTSADVDPKKKDGYFTDAMQSFQKAANINNNINVQDPIPYMAMARSLAQRGDLGDFFMSQLYMKQALQLDPTNPDTYAQLGIIYQQSRNFEGAIEAFQCALDGCDAQTSCDVRRDCSTNTTTTVKSMELSDTTLTYYYSYGSVLAGMSTPGNNYCSRASKIFTLLRSKYGRDTNVMAIVQAGESICSAPAPAQTATPLTGTGTPPTQPAPASTPTLPALQPSPTGAGG